MGREAGLTEGGHPHNLDEQAADQRRAQNSVTHMDHERPSLFEIACRF
jgi:hypothetical protein